MLMLSPGGGLSLCSVRPRVVNPGSRTASCQLLTATIGSAIVRLPRSRAAAIRLPSRLYTRCPVGRKRALAVRRYREGPSQRIDALQSLRRTMADCPAESASPTRQVLENLWNSCLLYTSPSPRD